MQWLKHVRNFPPWVPIPNTKVELIQQLLNLISADKIK